MTVERNALAVHSAVFLCRREATVNSQRREEADKP